MKRIKLIVVKLHGLHFSTHGPELALAITRLAKLCDQFLVPCLVEGTKNSPMFSRMQFPKSYLEDTVSWCQFHLKGAKQSRIVHNIDCLGKSCVSCSGWLSLCKHFKSRHCLHKPSLLKQTGHPKLFCRCVISLIRDKGHTEYGYGRSDS